MAYDYDYFVIGAGSGGVRSARIAAGHGAKVGIAESWHLGGTCVNVGCVPKKLFSYASDFHASFEDSKGFGWDVESKGFDWKTLLANKNTEIERLNGIYQKLLDNAGVTTHWGHAKFIDDHTIDIDGTQVTADKILIATGGTPRALGIPGEEHALSSDEIFFTPELPEEILILGGGYVAVEFAHIFAGLGRKVTLMYRKEMFLRSFDHDISEALAKEMEKQGITLIFNTMLTEIEKTDAGFRAQTTAGETIETGLIMAAIGRNANTGKLHLDAAGVEASRNGRLSVNSEFQTNVPHIYGVGDIVNDYALTPVAIAEGHYLADKLFGGEAHATRSFSYNKIATAIFSGPPIGTIGMSEQEARDAGHDITLYKSNFRPMKHTLSGRDERSVMKVIVDAKTDIVLGMHMMGADSPEIMQGFSVAMNMGMTKADLDATIGIHPTAAEEFVTMRMPVS